MRTRVSRSALHGGGELEVGDANIVVAAVEEDVGLREGGADGREVTVRRRWTMRNPKTEAGVSKGKPSGVSSLIRKL